MNVLLIEDQAMDRAMIDLALNRVATTVTLDWRQDGRGLLEHLRTRRYDCVLIDHQLPDASGLDLIREISRKLGDAAPALVMVTGTGDERLAANAIKAGADDYLPKSALPGPDLADALENALRTRQRKRRHAAQRREIERMALFDCLTGVSNRCSFDEDLERARAIAERAGSRFTLFILDLDGFKAINDDHGHPVGDAVLGVVGTRLRQTLRGTDKGFRIGGDEFAVIAETCDTPDAALHTAQRIYDTLTQPIHHHELTLAPGCSIGGTVYSLPGLSSAELIALTDAAMYRAKRNGHGIVITESHTGLHALAPQPVDPVASEIPAARHVDH